MNRSPHPTDEAIGQLPLETDEQAAIRSDLRAKHVLFDEILSVPIDRPVSRRSRVGRPRRTFVLAAAAASVGVAAAAGAAGLFRSDSAGVGCQTPDGAVSVVNAVTGDPVRDCAAHFAQQGDPATSLVAYDTGAGGIIVVSEGAQVSPGWTRLDPGPAQDLSVIELAAALDDSAEGLRSTCTTLASARDITVRELSRLGLDDWTVFAERGEADGVETCSYFVLDPADRTVALIPIEALVARAVAPHLVFARDLDAALGEDCLAVGAAGDVARGLAADAGLQVDAVVIVEVEEDEAGCTRAAVNVGGRVEVTLRGPAR